MLSNLTSDSLKGSHIGGAASTSTAVLGGGVNRNEDNVGLTNVARDLRGEDQVGRARGDRLLLGIVDRALARAITGNAHNVGQARLVDGRVAGVPAADTDWVSVDNDDADMGVLEGNHSSSRATYMQEKKRVC